MLVLVAWQSAGMAQAPVYGGKTITIIAGTKAGDVYDSYAHLFAQHLPKYIPGNPNIIVQNMPGAGSMLAGGRFGRPYVLPPGTPADRATIIRQAFQKVLADESVIAEAKKRRLEFDPTAGHDLEKLAK